MKNFNIFGVHGKIQVLEKGFHEKTICSVDCLKRGFGQFADLRGAWQERGGGVFEGGLIPQCTL